MRNRDFQNDELTVSCDGACVPVDATPPTAHFTGVSVFTWDIVEKAIERAGFTSVESDDGALIRDYCPACTP